MHAASNFTVLQPCEFCLLTHSPADPWCALSLGMPEQPPLPERSGGCGKSRCDNGFCACDMRTYDKEFRARTLSRVELYNTQLELRDSLLCRAASELVSRAVDSALGSVANYHKATLPASNLVTAEQPLVAAGQLLTMVDDDETAWPIDQVVAELSHAAQEQSRDMPWQRLTGEKTCSPTGNPVNRDNSALSPSGSVFTSVSTERLPITMDSAERLLTTETGHLVCAEQHPLADVSPGGALEHALMGGPSTVGSLDDCSTTDGELEECIGICATGQCADGCRCSLKLKRKRPVVHAPAADLADGTFKRPPLFQEGDAVEFTAPERRIKVRTFGIVSAVRHAGAQPYYVVTSTRGTIYSFSEDCLRRKGSIDPNFALRGSQLVTIGDTDSVGTILMLEPVDEVVDESADDLYADAEYGQDNSEDGAAALPDDKAREQALLFS